MLADRAVRGILAANLLAIVVAFLDGGNLLYLLWPYWIQSVVIGFFAQRRIRMLQRFSTEGLKMNGRAVAPTPASRRQAANFFVLHYGLFHLFYLVALLTFTGPMAAGRLSLGALSGWDTLTIVGVGIGFALSHRASHREHVEADLSGNPNLGALMFLPYLRIVPMHLTIILAAVLHSALGVLFFSVLKTVADVAMHIIEHRLLQRVAARTA